MHTRKFLLQPPHFLLIFDQNEKWSNQNSVSRLIHDNKYNTITRNYLHPHNKTEQQSKRNSFPSEICCTLLLLLKHCINFVVCSLLQRHVVHQEEKEKIENVRFIVDKIWRVYNLPLPLFPFIATSPTLESS